MPVAGIELRDRLVTRAVEVVRDCIDAFSIHADRILISADDIDGQVCRDLCGPLFTGNHIHHLLEIEKRTVVGRFCEGVERIRRVVSLDIGIRTDPLIPVTNFAAALAHPAEQFRGLRGIALISVAFIHQLLHGGDSFLCAREDVGGAADRHAGELISILCDKVSCDK